VRTHGTGKLFTDLVLGEKHAERPRDFAHLTDSKAISRLAKACHVWPQVCRLLSRRRNRTGGKAWPHSLLYASGVGLLGRRFPNGSCRPGRPLNPDTQPPSGENSVGQRRGLSLEVSQGQKRKTIAFLTDGNSTGEGKLQIGSQATVEYRSRDGTNVARRLSSRRPWLGSAVKLRGRTTENRFVRERKVSNP